MESETPANPAWEAISAVVCIAALIVIAVVMQMWPTDAVAASPTKRPNLEFLSDQWSRADTLQKVAKDRGFRKTNSANQSLLIRGWLDTWAPKRFHELSSREKEAAVKLTLNKLRRRS